MRSDCERGGAVPSGPLPSLPEAAAISPPRSVSDGLCVPRIEAESLAPYTSARLLDDGIIDPRDSRTALGMALSAVHSNQVEGTSNFGVFRM